MMFLAVTFIYTETFCGSLSMRIIPSMTLNGRSLLRRAYTKGSTEDIVSQLSDKFDMLYLSDIDGIIKNKPQLDVAREICEGIPTMYEGGLRFGQNVIDMLITGAESAVIGTATLVSLEELGIAFKLSENITFKADYRDGIVSFDPSIAGRAIFDLSRDVLEIGISNVLVPRELAEDASKAKRELGFTLGVFATMTDQSALERLEVDYIVTEDFGSMVSNE